ncbi:hypothetical protein [Microvirga massiliensis]|uniref:hypothetical protein n=1 Tax=Microvirga massiliensis TaxID=1033741 RepID=UPI00062B31F5|nr:hypothetical protein [Microvirga massiliensis]
MIDHLDLLSRLAEDLAGEILSEYTVEDYRGSEAVGRLRLVAEKLEQGNRPNPPVVCIVIRNAEPVLH